MVLKGRFGPINFGKISFGPFARKYFASAVVELRSPVPEESMEEIGDVFNGLGEICPDPPSKRALCDRCRRPVTVCWCPFLPVDRLSISTNVFILQHPFEESRPLQTARMLSQGISPGKCSIFKGKRFCSEKYTSLRHTLAEPNTLLMFPGPQATDLQQFLTEEDQDGTNSKTEYNLVLLDGTWSQAKGLYCKNPWLQHCRQVQLTNTGLSEYTIRTQPNDASLSTLETGAIALSMMERRPDIHNVLVEPLRALCKFQIEFGAVTHQSKQYLIDHGLYQKQQSLKQRNQTSKYTTPHPASERECPSATL